jgi:hypothetical protein
MVRRPDRLFETCRHRCVVAELRFGLANDPSEDVFVAARPRRRESRFLHDALHAAEVVTHSAAGTSAGRHIRPLEPSQAAAAASRTAQGHRHVKWTGSSFLRRWRQLQQRVHLRQPSNAGARGGSARMAQHFGSGRKCNAGALFRLGLI